MVALTAVTTVGIRVVSNFAAGVTDYADATWTEVDPAGHLHLHDAADRVVATYAAGAWYLATLLRVDE